MKRVQFLIFLAVVFSRCSVCDEVEEARRLLDSAPSELRQLQPRVIEDYLSNSDQGAHAEMEEVKQNASIPAEEKTLWGKPQSSIRPSAIVDGRVQVEHQEETLFFFFYDYQTRKEDMRSRVYILWILAALMLLFKKGAGYFVERTKCRTGFGEL